MGEKTGPLHRGQYRIPAVCRGSANCLKGDGIMKKLFLLFISLIAVTAAVNAAGPFAGAKLGGSFGFHKDSDDIAALLAGHSVDDKSKGAFALAGYGGVLFYR
jgi:hypothetical protein